MLKQLDRSLLNLAWSLWTEVGVAGTLRNHQNILILLEELVLFTSVLSEIDPRLRDESIDWCSQYGRYISVSRLKSLMGDFEGLIKEPFSKYAAVINDLTKANWPILVGNVVPLQIRLSGKSVLRPHASPALLNIRARSIFGTSSRADLVTFFLVHPDSDFSVADTTEIGYSKRNLAEVLEDLHFGRLFGQFQQGNQLRYRLNKESPLFNLLKPIPQYPRPWRLVFKVLLSLRACMKRTEDYSETSKVIEIRNFLAELELPIQKLGISLPPFLNNFSAYLESFNQWLLEWASLLAQGK